MVFRSNIDNFFRIFIGSAVLLIGAVTFWPLLLEEGTDLPEVLLLSSIFLIIAGFICWTAFSVTYVFKQDHLLVKGGPFRSRIPYEAITKVKPTTAIFTGYRILSSRDAIEMFNRSTAFGSVKISPKPQNEFIAELKKRCPHVQIQCIEVEE